MSLARTQFRPDWFMVLCAAARISSSVYVMVWEMFLACIRHVPRMYDTMSHGHGVLRIC